MTQAPECDVAHIIRRRMLVAFLLSGGSYDSFSRHHRLRLLVGDQAKERQMKKTALILATVAALTATAATVPAEARSLGVGASATAIAAAAVAAGVAADAYGYGRGYGYAPVYYGAPGYYGGWHHGYRHYW
jgi:hypothetical protein